MRKLNAAALVILAAIFASCATAPRLPAPSVEDDLPPEFSLLPAGGSVYLWADTVTARPLLDALDFRGMSGNDAAAILNRTESAAAVVFDDSHDRGFFLSAAGNYPRGRANFAFAFSRHWRRHKGYGKQTYWLSRDGAFAVSLGRRVALVSDKDPFENFQRVIPPPAFAEFRNGMALAGWVNNPAAPISNFLSVMGVPIQIPAQDLFFGAANVPKSPQAGETAALWDISLHLRTPSALHARSLFALVSTARIFILQSGASGAEGNTPSQAGKSSPNLHDAAMLLFANAPELHGEYLTFRINSVDETRISLLFQIFSVYSKN